MNRPEEKYSNVKSIIVGVRQRGNDPSQHTEIKGGRKVNERGRTTGKGAMVGTGGQHRSANLASMCVDGNDRRTRRGLFTRARSPKGGKSGGLVSTEEVPSPGESTSDKNCLALEIRRGRQKGRRTIPPFFAR